MRLSPMLFLLTMLWQHQLSAFVASEVEALSPIAVAERYFSNLRTGNIDGVIALFHDSVIWHQPGNSILSKTYYGKNEVIGLFERFITISQGSFKIDEVSAIMGNGDLITATLSFSASKGDGHAISMAGVDLMKIVDGKIAEVWLFSADQEEEDVFWGLR